MGGAKSVAVGYDAGRQNQGADAVAVGHLAGDINQNSNSIILNASGVALNAANTGFYVKPLRTSAVTNAVQYNTATGEISYNTSSRDTKQNIELYNDDSVVNKIKQLGDNVSTFEYKEDPDVKQLGLIAEDTFDIDPLFAVVDKDNKPININWNAVVSLLLKH